MRLPRGGWRSSIPCSTTSATPSTALRRVWHRAGVSANEPSGAPPVRPRGCRGGAPGRTGRRIWSPTRRAEKVIPFLIALTRDYSEHDARLRRIVDRVGGRTACPAGEAVAGAPGAGDPAGGGDGGHPHRRPGDRGDEPGPRGGDRGGPVPRRPVLAHRRLPHRDSAVARAPGGYPGARGALSGPACRTPWPVHSRAVHRRAAGACCATTDPATCGSWRVRSGGRC